MCIQSITKSGLFSSSVFLRFLPFFHLHLSTESNPIFSRVDWYEYSPNRSLLFPPSNPLAVSNLTAKVLFYNNKYDHIFPLRRTSMVSHCSDEAPEFCMPSRPCRSWGCLPSLPMRPTTPSGCSVLWASDDLQYASSLSTQAIPVRSFHILTYSAPRISSSLSFEIQYKYLFLKESFLGPQTRLGLFYTGSEHLLINIHTLFCLFKKK